MLRGVGLARPCHHPPVDAAWDLPVTPPVSPMLAASPVDAVPDDPDLAFEPKWDGFRAIVFRSGERVEIQGRGGDDLSYAFPEVAEAVRRELPPRIVLDGEIVVIHDGGLDFAALGSRLRPRSESASIQRLAEEHPATLIAFDILALGDSSLMDLPYLERRNALESLSVDGGLVRVTPMTRDRSEAKRWFVDVEGAGLDGLIAKQVAAAYQPGKRAMAKVKHRRTLDAVVAGWRPHAKDPDEIGSLLLGLYDEHGRLHHVGAVSGLSAARRRELTTDLRDLRVADDADHPWRVAGDAGNDGVRRPGGVNRWSGGRDKPWHALLPERVAEVAYDQFEGPRLRHLATWLRWRPDRDATSCTYAQAPVIATVGITDVLDLG
jgi:ATP-dependent DNA ligase